MASTSNFTLRITLYKTSNPVVNRLLTIPDDLLFEELHQTIVAAFDWDDPDDPCTSWIFRLCSRDSMKISNPDNYSGDLTAYFTTPNRGYETKPALLHTATPVSELFAPAKMGYSKFWTYNYGLSKYHHAIEIVQTTGHDTRGRIQCIEQGGQISHKAWQFGDLRRSKDVETQIKGIKTVDVGVHERLTKVQEAYEMRKADEERPFKRHKIDAVEAVPVKAEGSSVDDEEDILFRRIQRTGRRSGLSRYKGRRAFRRWIRYGDSESQES